MAGKRNTTEQFVEKARKKHGDRYDYSNVVYTHSMSLVVITCQQHGAFNIVASAHLSGKGCTVCGRNATKGTTEEFVAQSRALYGDRFDYTNTHYNTLRTKVTVRCRVHGPFSTLPFNHLRGNGGCRACSGNKPLDTTSFKARIEKLHGDKYDLSKVVYTSARNRVVVGCRVHGDYEVVASEFLKGSGCVKCVHARNTLTTEQFVEKAKAIHGELYDYSKVRYVYSDQKVEIICKEHGGFLQTPSSHLMGNHCSACRSVVSRAETKWLDSLGVAKHERQVRLRMASGKLYSVDAYVKAKNMVYEFNGDYWHGNPAKYDKDAVNEMSKVTFGELFDQTQSKLKELLENGYGVTSIWESEFVAQTGFRPKRRKKP